MSNDYYQRQEQFQPRTKAKSDQVRSELDAVQTGFEKLPTPTAEADGFAGPVKVGTATDPKHAATLDQLLGTEALTDQNVQAAQVAQAAAETAQTSAETAQVDANSSAVAAAADRAQAMVYSTQTALDAAATADDRAKTAADRAQVELDASAAAVDRVQVGSDATQVAADRVQTGADRVQTGLDRVQTSNDAAATAADRVQTSADVAASEASKQTAARWAAESVDVEVEPGLFSAQHWATKAAQVVSAGVIDDAGQSQAFTWSSEKISRVLDEKMDANQVNQVLSALESEDYGLITSAPDATADFGALI